jgi:hypothetical protein
MRRFGLTILIALTVLTPSSSAATPSNLVNFEQTGGFASIERGFAVRTSGVVVSDGLPVTTKRLSAKRLAALRTALTQARWVTLARRYESETPISDGYVYRVTYAGKTIKIEQDAKLPARLARPFSLLRTLGGIRG